MGILQRYMRVQCLLMLLKVCYFILLMLFEVCYCILLMLLEVIYCILLMLEMLLYFIDVVEVCYFILLMLLEVCYFILLILLPCSPCSGNRMFSADSTGVVFLWHTMVDPKGKSSSKKNKRGTGGKIRLRDWL